MGDLRRMLWWILCVFVAIAMLPACSFAMWADDGTPLCTAAGHQVSPAITSDGAGGAIVAWYDSRGGDYDIYAQRVDASGVVQWAANGVALCTATGDQLFPEIASDGAGGAIVAWGDKRSGTADIYAQRINASGDVLWVPNGVALCTAASAQGAPQITSDGAGGVVVAWQDWRSGNNDVYAQRVNASGIVQWVPDGVALCTAAGLQYGHQITSDGAGGAIVTWLDERGSNRDIYAQRVNGPGDVQWALNGVALCTAVGDQFYPVIVSDAAGGAIVVWSDVRSAESDIYAERVSASGVVQWAPNGVALCSATGSQVACGVTSDGAGGAIVVWRDLRGGSDYDIYVQRVNASGEVQWAADGVALCTASGEQQYAEITPDGAGGAIVAWQDYRSGGDYDIYVRGVSASGVVEWTPDGVALCAAVSDQVDPRITSDGAGGAIVTWYDSRSWTNYDVYAQRVDADGHLIGVEQGESTVPVSLLEQNVPNPFNPVTLIGFAVAEPGIVRLAVYDVSGRSVRALADGVKHAGKHEVTWDGRDDEGRAVPSGVYVYKLEAPGCVESRKMVLLR